MKRLPTPIRRTLRDVDVEVVDRAWAVIERKRVRHAGPRVALALAFAMIAIVAVLAFLPRAPKAGPLRADGAIVTSLAAIEIGRRTTLSDGSVIALDAGASLSVLENTDAAFTTLLGAGAATFDVVPGGPRRWRIELGVGAVEVVGTRFSIDRGAARVIIRVERGAVLVRSDRIEPHHVERLEAGGSLVLDVSSPPASSSATVTDDAPIPPPSAAEAPPPPAATSSAGDVDALLVRADTARRAGRSGEAATLLRRLASEHPSDPRAAIAMFTLAKLELDSLGAASAAANDFGRSLAMGLPGALREDAEARRIEALARAGRRDEARVAAERFRGDHPSSASLSEIDRWTGASR